MKPTLIFVAILLQFIGIAAVAENRIIHVELSDLTTLDDGGVHITMLKSEPNTILKLPSVDTTDAKFCDIFYTWDTNEDPNISVLILPKKDIDELYIDLNNDEDLTNDGSPFVFPHEDKNFYFDIISNEDSNRKTKIALHRRPDVPDSNVSNWIDENGNLNSKVAKIYGSQSGNFNYRGERGSFYFDDRVTLRRGELRLDEMNIQFGIFDYTNNGSFVDSLDVIIIDPVSYLFDIT